MHKVFVLFHTLSLFCLAPLDELSHICASKHLQQLTRAEREKTDVEERSSRQGARRGKRGEQYFIHLIEIDLCSSKIVEYNTMFGQLHFTQKLVP